MTTSEAAPITAVDTVEIEDEVAAEERGRRPGGPARVVLATKRVTADDPYLEAHFPGRPVYPGVFVLETVHQAVAGLPDLGGATAMVSGIRSLRFHEAVRPGDLLQVRARVVAADGRGHEVDARCRTADGREVAVVRLEVGGRADGSEQSPAPPPGPGELSGPSGAPDPHAILPHGAAFVLVDEVEGTDSAGRLVVARTVRADEPCYRRLPAGTDPRDHAYPASLLLESFGQSAALAWVVRTGRPAGLDEVLMFAAARNCRLTGRPHPGDVVRHRVRIDSVVAGTAFASGDTWVGSRRLAEWGSLVAVVRPADVLPTLRMVDDVGAAGAVGPIGGDGRGPGC